MVQQRSSGQASAVVVDVNAALGDRVMAHIVRVKKGKNKGKPMCFSEKGKLLKLSACGKGKKHAKKAKKARKGKARKSKKPCKGTYHVRKYTVPAQNRKCPKRRK